MVDASVLTHPCFGIAALGLCAYDPSAPQIAYFSLGDAIAALAFTLAVQQLLRPILRFRMRARFLSPAKLNTLIFFGLMLAGVGAMVPFISARNRDTILLYPFIWELLAAFCFALGYALLIFTVAPVRVKEMFLERFARSAADFLSAADDRDRADFAPDLAASLPRLIKVASKAEGRNPTGKPPSEAVLRRAGWAASILRIFADPGLCSALVRKAPWRVARAIAYLDKQRLYSPQAEPFIQELARQAVISDDSLLAREVAFNGFAEAPMLTVNLFEAHHIVSRFNPLGGLSFSTDGEFRAGVIERYNHAAEKCLMTLIAAGGGNGAAVSFSIRSYYQGAFIRVWTSEDEGPIDLDTTRALRGSLRMVIRVCGVYLERVADNDWNYLFVENIEETRSDLLDLFSETIVDALGMMGNVFTDFRGQHWGTVHETMSAIFPPIGDQPDGMNPFQQRVAILLIKKLRENMDGFYPAVSVILLATIGPFERKYSQKNDTAFVLLRKAVYLELKKMKNLADRLPEKIGDFLPDNVKYDVLSNALLHSYRSGDPHITRLDQIPVEPIELAATEIRLAKPEIVKTSPA